MWRIICRHHALHAGRYGIDALQIIDAAEITGPQHSQRLEALIEGEQHGKAQGCPTPATKAMAKPLERSRTKPLDTATDASCPNRAQPGGRT